MTGIKGRLPKVRRTPLTRGLSHWWTAQAARAVHCYQVPDLVGSWHGTMGITNGVTAQTRSVQYDNGISPLGRGFWYKFDDANGAFGNNNGHIGIVPLQPDGSSTAIDDFTVAVWHRPQNNGSFDRLIDANFSAGFWLGRFSGSATLFRGGVLAGGGNNGVSFTVADGTWIHLCYTRVASTGAHVAYENGVATGATYTGGTGSGTWNNPTRFMLNGSNSPGNDSCLGGMDDIAVWDRVLSAEEVMAWYASSRNGHRAELVHEADPYADIFGTGGGGGGGGSDIFESSVFASSVFNSRTFGGIG